MIWRWLMLTVFVVFSPARLCAQPPDSSPPTIQLFNEPANYDKMYEDIEIFRRILDRMLHPLYPRTQARNPFISTYLTYLTLSELGTHSNMLRLIAPGAGPSSWILDPNTAVLIPNPDMTGSEVVLPSLEGVYLKGQGVIYTARLSSLQTAEKADAPKPVSEWDSVRRQLHNEKEEPKKAEASKPPTLSDALLKALAENGHNFAQLGENESLTIVLTVHQPDSPSPARKSGGRGSGFYAKTGSQAPKNTRVSKLVAVSDAELLGDLHQRQEHYEEAIKAFGSAAVREPGPDSNEAARLYRKIAQCYLALGEDEKARKALDHISALRKESADPKDKPAPAAKPAAALPTKLIISAPKKLLIEAKEGKISFAEFRAKAHVETLRFDDRR